MAKRNRSAGHSLELEEAAWLRESGLFPHAVTCRSESRSRDGEKVDIINKNERVNGRIPYNIQCKNSCQTPRYNQLLAMMPRIEGIINVVFHKLTQKSEGGKFMGKGRFAILRLEDFKIMMKQRRGYEILLSELGALPPDKQQAVRSQLKSIGL